MSATLSIAFLLGLASTLHCWGMCGGILAVFTLGTPGTLPRRGLLVAGFNFGRIASYTLAGAVAGGLGSAVTALPWRTPLYLALQAGAGLLLVAAGLRLGGWLRHGDWLESAGAQAWSRVQPLCRHLLPVDRLSRALALGMLWGWIPCGLVYATLAWSAASTGVMDGAAVMLAFGAGTLPAMIGAGLAGSRIIKGGIGTGTRRALALVLVLLGVAGPVASWHFAAGHHGSHSAHDGHGPG